MAENEREPSEQPRRNYTWPWWVLAAVLLAILLAILWMSVAVAKLRKNRPLNPPSSSLSMAPREAGRSWSGSAADSRPL